MEAVEVLQQTKRLLERQQVLAVGHYHESKTGNMCIKGALRMAATGDVAVLALTDPVRPAYLEAYGLLLDAVGVNPTRRRRDLDLDDRELPMWNDEGRTVQEAVALIDKAIALSAIPLILES